ncbi:MAG: hypothetical protein L3K09_02370 [Thermoplasmata archaeon]|nr:hypothetical protein [Thermoplasmata archaeon]
MSPAVKRHKKPTKREVAAAAAAAAAARPFNPHHLVPKHELMSEEESRKTFELLGTAPERLPKILTNDPGLRTDPKYIAAREAHEVLAGRLVRVRRPSQTAGEAIAYRLLISSVGE